jgi:glyoxalase superfamily protein
MPPTHVRELRGSQISKIQEDGDTWFVMRDPEGNEFCLIPIVADTISS